MNLRFLTDEEIVYQTGIHTSPQMTRDELHWIACCVDNVEWTPSLNILEIGSFEGFTALFLLRVQERLGIHVPMLHIDPFERGQPDQHYQIGGLGAWTRHVFKWGGFGRCIPMIARSQDVAELIQIPFGFVIVDGSHTYEDCLSDLQLYSPKVVPGGFLLVDDTYDDFPDVRRACADWMATNPPFRVVHESYFTILQRERE